MPISDIWSYVTTGNEFDAHWVEVNAQRVANTLTDLTLPDGYSQTALTADVASVQAQLTAIEDLDNSFAVAITTRDNLKKALRERVIEFRDAVDFRLKGSGYDRALPDTPHLHSSEQKTLKALDDMESTWTRINADASVPNFTPPLLLRADYALADLETELTALRNGYRTVTIAENHLRVQRSQRDVLLDPLRDRFVSYRQAVAVEYGEGHPLVTSLPDVYPQPGSTPDAVVASGQWDSAMMEAVITWPASSDPNLAAYKIRMSPGASYDSGNSTVIGTEPSTTLEHRTTQGLANSGDVASFKVFVILTTGNESGSNTVTITRPEV